ncbi:MULTISPECIES: zinc transporter ZupT [Sporomusa]|jgi:ZIP family zinc transporter|uniref:zinc transporter ZupT n=1 Tax=Sporomusa TaxID=2375 RepID=UPI001663F946|nr:MULTISPECIES: zinc transporter ZupT [Sporomusa]MCM0758363.1 zinc transporter ZupT [Sporomusa sphaeroides DSM 2875]HML34862.1 zinc transporter ZupT [Sporomusa sphaeroides]
MSDNVVLAFILTSIAGLATGVGGLLAFLVKRNNTRLLSVGLGFSAGIMIYVSFVELLRQAEGSLIAHMGDPMGKWITIASFFGGILLSILLDKLVPEHMSYHEVDVNAAQETQKLSAEKLKRMGLFTAFAIALHNFPEGLATFIGTLDDPALGVSLAAAIAIHNIPEGMSVALPIYYATGNTLQAFGYSLLSGLAEPVGGLLGYIVLKTFLNEMVLGVTFAAVAGIMVYISLDELLPMARESGTGHSEMFGLVLGMLVMAVSLLLF